MPQVSNRPFESSRQPLQP